MKRHTIFSALEALDIKLSETQPVDSVQMNVPLFIRLMEFSREDADSDLILHRVAERLIEICKDGTIATMDHYEDLVGKENSEKDK